MPVTRTAKRALRKSKYKEERNKIARARIKDVIREIKKVAEGKKEGDRKELEKKAAKIFDKAAKKNVIHSNKAARLKSRLTKKLNAIQEKKKEETKTQKKPNTKKKK